MKGLWLCNQGSTFKSQRSRTFGSDITTCGFKISLLVNKAMKGPSLTLEVSLVKYFHFPYKPYDEYYYVVYLKY